MHSLIPKTFYTSNLYMCSMQKNPVTDQSWWCRRPGNKAMQAGVLFLPIWFVVRFLAEMAHQSLYRTGVLFLQFWLN